MSVSVDEINFFDPATNDCPYPAYEKLREEAPVWLDPRTGMYFVTRYEDIRAILLDTKRYSNGVGNGANNTGKAVKADDPIAIRAAKLAKLYEEKGWTPAPSLDARDEPNHMQMRRMFDHAFRWDLFLGSLALNGVFLVIGLGTYLWSFARARQLGLLLQVGE